MSIQKAIESLNEMRQVDELIQERTEAAHRTLSTTLTLFEPGENAKIHELSEELQALKKGLWRAIEALQTCKPLDAMSILYQMADELNPPAPPTCYDGIDQQA